MRLSGLHGIKTFQKVFDHRQRGVGVAPDEHGLHGRQSGWKRAKDDAGTANLDEGCGHRRDAESGGDQPHFDLHVLRVLGDMGFGASFRAGGNE